MSRLCSILALGATLGGTLTCALSASTEIVIDYTFSICAKGDCLVQVRGVFGKAHEHPSRSLETCIYQLRKSLSFCNQFTRTFPLLFQLTRVILSSFRRRLSPITRYLTGIPCSYRLVSPFVRVINCGCLRLVAVGDAVGIDVDTRPPRSVYYRQTIARGVAGLTATLLGLLRLLLQLRNTSCSFLFGVSITTSSHRLVVFGHAGESRRCTFGHPFRGGVEKNHRGLFEASLNSAVRRFNPLSRLFSRSHSGVCSLFTLSGAGLQRPLAELRSPLTCKLGVVCIEETGVLF